jgi:hypothetical protein
MTKKHNQKVLIALFVGASFFSFLFVNSQKGFSVRNTTQINTDLLHTEVIEENEQSKHLTVPALSAIEKVFTIVKKLIPGN